MKSAVRSVGWLLCLALVAAVGCGGDSGVEGGITVKGKVTQGGQPYPIGPKGQITLIFNAGLNTYPAVVNPDATYEVEVPAGTYKVQVQYMDPFPGPDKLGGKYFDATPIEKTITGAADDLDIEVPAGS